MEASRRGFFGFLAGAVAAAPHAGTLVADLFDATAVTTPAVTAVGFSAELAAITRKAFIPKLTVQIYQSAPFLSALLLPEPSA